MKRVQGIAYVAAGVMLGAAITGNAAQAAEMLAAQRSTQKIYVNGQQVRMEAYAIGGSNYVKLRDVGKAVGFERTAGSSRSPRTAASIRPAWAT